MEGFVFGILVIFAVILLISRFSKEQLPPDYNYVYQGGTLSGMKGGDYDGGECINTIIKQGTYGIGVLEGLEGELIIMGGGIYQAGSDCVAKKASFEALSPFYMITQFYGDGEKSVGAISSFSQLLSYLAQENLSSDRVYAIKITGEFESVTLRGVDRVKKPYRSFADIIAKIAPVTQTKMRGTAFGFIMPSYCNGINEEGLHLHFLNNDKTFAGHVLDLSLLKGTIQIEERRGISLKLDKIPFSPQPSKKEA